MNAVDWLPRATAWLALLLYVAALLARPGRARLLWTAGFLALVVHVAAAFHFVHGWSHAAASDATDRQTLALTGMNFRGGLFVNYAFLLLWLADVVWWWVDTRSYERRPRAVEYAVQGIFAFLFFNAAVVFATGVGRWLGVAVFAALAGKWAFATRRDSV